ncbi:MAG: toll/interleukin-1 receptor domain-containing protein [Verrucomicrobia bacterium]|nr:toll/interleukin-1 receptor domain-containing protein [Verrucomicrobiota bacterium]
MSGPTFSKPVGEIVSTLTELFLHQGRTQLVEILANAHAYFEETNFDNWNGGTYTWALRLEVPVALFAAVEGQLEKFEKEIGAKLGYFSRIFPNDILDEVTILPILPGATARGQRIAPSELEVKRLWPTGRLRLFLSHVSKHKGPVAKLRDELALRGVAAFVAHDDIEPSLEWQAEIELALRSMHALAACLTPEFHASPWTDHEVGWGLGRGVPVIPVRVGADPYGLAGKFQAVSGQLEQPAPLAIGIVNALLLSPQTHGEMRRALVAAFTGAESYVMAQALTPIVLTVGDFTAEEKDALRVACTSNSNVAKAHYVSEKIYKTFGAPPAAKSADVLDEEVPF